MSKKKRFETFEFNEEVFNHKNKRATKRAKCCYICGKTLKDGMVVGQVIVCRDKLVGAFLVENRCYKNAQSIIDIKKGLR